MNGAREPFGKGFRLRVKATDGLQLHRAAALLRPRAKVIFGVALLFAAAGVVSQNDFTQLTFALVAASLGLATLWILFVARQTESSDFQAIRTVRALCEHDLAPTFLTGPDGVLLYTNTAANDVFDMSTEITFERALGGMLAAPGPLLSEMDAEATLSGTARRELSTSEHLLRLTANRVGNGRVLWRMDNYPAEDRARPSEVPVAAITLGADDTVLAVNSAARALLSENADSVALFCPRPPVLAGEINDIRTPDRLISCFAAEASSPDGGRVLYLFPVPILKMSSDGTIELSNRFARALLGVQSGEGRRLSDLLDGPGRPINEWLRDAAAGRGTVQAEVLQVRGSDSDAFVQVTLNPTLDNGKTVLIAVLHDATKLKSLEEQFVQSQKMQAIGQLAGGVAHDFNNLLTAISGHCDLLLLRHGQEDVDYSDLMQINQNANRAAALVGQLLAYSRKQTLRPEIMDTREMLSDLTHLLNRLVGEKVVLSLTHDPALWAVRADKRQLEQVLMNLVVNARDAMPEGGEIRIRTENRLLEEPLCRDRAKVAPGRYVMVSVTDFGVGIPAEKHEKVFEPFYTTKRAGEGTGLGLSTAYGIVKQTGGFIFIDSVPGEGTTFMMLLPAHETVEIEARDPRARAPRVARYKGVVLLVEDEAPVRAFASRALKMRGLSDRSGFGGRGTWNA